jgi:hypothetical protein
MDVKKLLDRPIAFHRCFITMTGSVNAALMLSQAFYWSNRTNDSEGWFHKSSEEWQEEIGLTRHQQDMARKKLLATGFWHEDLRGSPPVVHFRIDTDKLQEVLQSGDFNLPENGKSICRKTANQFAGKRRIEWPESGKSIRRKTAKPPYRNRDYYRDYSRE